MRRIGLGVLLLGALLLCTLIAGTPVNNDQSPPAETAGIHLTTPPSHAKVGQASISAVVALLVMAVILAIRPPVAASLPRRDGTAGAPDRSLLRSRTGTRRGPPTFAW